MAAMDDEERFGWGDLLLAGAIAAFVWALTRLWPLPDLPPVLWEAVAASAGLRPPEHVVPGFAGCAAHGGAAFLRAAGPVALALGAAFAFFIYRNVLALVVRERPQRSRRRTVAMRFAAAVAAVAFALAGPVWTAGQALSETTLLLVLTLGAVNAALAFVRTGSPPMLYAGAAAGGLLLSATPFGLVPLLILAGVKKPLPALAFLSVRRWPATFLFLAALAGGAALQVWTFVRQGGLAANALTPGGMALAALRERGATLTQAAGLGSGLLAVGLFLCPFIVALRLFPVAADEDRVLPYGVGLVYLFFGALALTQGAALPDLWFWTHVPGLSSYALGLGLLVSAGTLALVLAVLALECLCRERPFVRGWPLPVRFAGLCLVALAVGGAFWPERHQRAAQTLQGFVTDAVRAIVAEAQGLDALVTDGHLDAAIELASGGRVTCRSLMGRSAPREVFLRTRGLAEAAGETALAFRRDAGLGLRTLIRDQPKRLARIGALAGFVLWAREGKSPPQMGGFMARPGGFPTEAARADAIAAAHALARRVENAHAPGGAFAACIDGPLREAFLTVQWRLAVLCEARREDALARRLNALNPIYAEIERAVEKSRALAMRRSTPREGLLIALVRADFRAAQSFAEAILADLPDDPDAHFALAMRTVEQRRFEVARDHLLRALSARPDEPTLNNNLAMVDLELGHYDEADRHLAKALARVPDSPAFLDTQRRLRLARERQDKEKEAKSEAAK